LKPRCQLPPTRLPQEFGRYLACCVTLELSHESNYLQDSIGIYIYDAATFTVRTSICRFRLVRMEQMPAQNNTYDCGFYMAVFAEMFTKRTDWRDLKNC
uniref:ULP_PROTEASE domain-containing protein n=1 Tax=Heligmosomoides polygyrus TaxID=6339 RepID=A0A183GIT5_HELPZ